MFARAHSGLVMEIAWLHKSGRIIIGVRQRGYCKLLKHFIQGLVITVDNRLAIAASFSSSYSWVCRARNRTKNSINLATFKEKTVAKFKNVVAKKFNNTKSDNLTMGTGEKNWPQNYGRKRQNI